MLLIDDVLLRALGLSLKPFDMIWMLELMRDCALKEKYNTKEIKNQIKENRLLFEIEEISEEEYKEKNVLLLESLEKANEIMTNLSSNMQIQEGIKRGVENG